MLRTEERNLLNFFLDVDNSDDAENQEYLKDANIDAEKSNKEILNIIKKHAARLKIDEGKEFKKNYEEMLNKNSIEDGEAIENEELLIAYRKNKSSSATEREEIEKDLRKMKIIEELKYKDVRKGKNKS
jgi:hypothetical protein